MEALSPGAVGPGARLAGASGSGPPVPPRAPLDRLDPRTRLAGTVCFAVLLVAAPGWRGIAPFLPVTAAAVALARPGLPLVRRALLPVVGLMALTVGLQVVETWLGGGGAASALAAGARGAARLWLLALESSAAILPVDPPTLTRAAARLLGPLRRVGLPADDVGLMAGLALSFLPLLATESTRIRTAQAARGADPARGTPLARARALVALLVPLLLSVFRRAEGLALAMAARGYGVAPRSAWRAGRWGAVDGVAATVVAALGVWVALLRLYPG